MALQKKKKRVGRGIGSGNGKTCGTGHKGQKSRSGQKIRPDFEGGQMPLIRRMAKRGFNNIFKKTYQEVNIEQITKKFKKDDIITREKLYEAGVIKSNKKPVKVLGMGDIEFPVMLKIDAATKSAVDKVTAAGGTIEVVS